MDWPAYSPDLNPIEHMWDMLGRRIAARHPPPTCLPELRRGLLDEWCNIPQDQIDTQKIKGVSEILIQILVPHPNMQLIPSFGIPAPASSVPEGTSISSAKVTGVSQVRFQILVPHPEKNMERALHTKNFKISGSNCQSQNTPRIKFSLSKAFKVSPWQSVSKIPKNSHPALSDKIATISYIGYQLQIARFQIRQGPSSHATWPLWLSPARKYLKYGHPALYSKDTGILGIQFKIRIPRSKLHKSLTFHAPWSTKSASAGTCVFRHFATFPVFRILRIFGNKKNNDAKN
ncbi:transposable element Tcb1 transposase [Trichonephila clavipes]|nr:transposable element Tcb1 transposase [Trichonephila clavipes]